jgi:pimeloyl-ACP methyl ester carboxylesterase
MAIEAAARTGSQVVVVPDCGHFPWIEQPGSVRNAVESFLAR